MLFKKSFIMSKVKLTSSFIAMMCISLIGCGGGSGSSNAAPQAMSAAAQVGDKIFHDVSLSVPGSQSCATCHNPDRAHAGADGRAVPLGGAASDQPGFRKPPPCVI